MKKLKLKIIFFVYQQKHKAIKAVKFCVQQNGIDKAEFTDKNSDKYYSHIQILLAKDYFIRKKYLDGFKIITTTGYKILIETENDLYQ